MILEIYRGNMFLHKNKDMGIIAINQPCAIEVQSVIYCINM